MNWRIMCVLVMYLVIPHVKESRNNTENDNKGRQEDTHTHTHKSAGLYYKKKLGRPGKRKQHGGSSYVHDTLVKDGQRMKEGIKKSARIHLQGRFLALLG